MLIHSWQCQFFKLLWKNIQQYSLKLNVSMPCWSIILIFASQDTHYAVNSSIISNSMKIKVESKSPEEDLLHSLFSAYPQQETCPASPTRMLPLYFSSKRKEDFLLAHQQLQALRCYHLGANEKLSVPWTLAVLLDGLCFKAVLLSFLPHPL